MTFDNEHHLSAIASPNTIPTSLQYLQHLQDATTMDSGPNHEPYLYRYVFLYLFIMDVQAYTGSRTSTIPYATPTAARRTSGWTGGTILR